MARHDTRHRCSVTSVLGKAESQAQGSTEWSESWRNVVEWCITWAGSGVYPQSYCDGHTSCGATSSIVCVGFDSVVVVGHGGATACDSVNIPCVAI